MFLSLQQATACKSDKNREAETRKEEAKAQRTIDSYLGILSHTASYRMAQSIGLSKPLAA